MMRFTHAVRQTKLFPDIFCSRSNSQPTQVNRTDPTDSTELQKHCQNNDQDWKMRQLQNSVAKISTFCLLFPLVYPSSKCSESGDSADYTQECLGGYSELELWGIICQLEPTLMLTNEGSPFGKGTPYFLQTIMTLSKKKKIKKKIKSKLQALLFHKDIQA